MRDFVSGLLKEGVGQVSADLVQILPLELTPPIEITPEEGTVVYDSNREAGAPDFVEYGRRLNEIYYRGQANAFGFQLPLDPSRANGIAYPVPEDLRREDFKSNEEFEAARSDQADALSSQEKNALQGVPLG